tara:strand:- start:710 stop:1834 length:1125 start_codon:yes stop_codon:yes gene_type:complete
MSLLNKQHSVETTKTEDSIDMIVTDHQPQHPMYSLGRTNAEQKEMVAEYIQKNMFSPTEATVSPTYETFMNNVTNENKNDIYELNDKPKVVGTALMLAVQRDDLENVQKILQLEPDTSIEAIQHYNTSSGKGQTETALSFAISNALERSENAVDIVYELINAAAEHGIYDLHSAIDKETPMGVIRLLSRDVFGAAKKSGFMTKYNALNHAVNSRRLDILDWLTKPPSAPFFIDLNDAITNESLVRSVRGETVHEHAMNTIWLLAVKWLNNKTFYEEKQDEIQEKTLDTTNFVEFAKNLLRSQGKAIYFEQNDIVQADERWGNTEYTVVKDEQLEEQFFNDFHSKLFQAANEEAMATILQQASEKAGDIFEKLYG